MWGGRRHRHRHRHQRHDAPLPARRASLSRARRSRRRVGAHALTARRKRARSAVVQDECLEDLRYWVDTNRKTALRVLDVMGAMVRDPTVGISKSELLKRSGDNVWSRRVNEGDRLV